MRQLVSPSTGATYGLARVCRVWELAPSTSLPTTSWRARARRPPRPASRTGSCCASSARSSKCPTRTGASSSACSTRSCSSTGSSTWRGRHDDGQDGTSPGATGVGRVDRE